MARSDIYGIDTNDFAEGIASEALRPGSSEYADSGVPTGGLRSKGNKPLGEDTVAVKNVGGGDDSRACVKGNHGEQGCND